MISVAERLRQGLEVARQTGRKPVRVTMSTKDAGALATEDAEGVDYGVDGRPASIGGVPITVIHGLSSSTITTEVEGLRGQSAAVI